MRMSLLSLAVVLLALGCGSRYKTAPVSGTITYKGKPVEHGTVTFYPRSGEAPASGPIGRGGEFILTTDRPNDGAIPGKHKVTVRAYGNTADVSVAANPAKDQAVPSKYADAGTTTLSVDVIDGPNHFDLKLD